MAYIAVSGCELEHALFSAIGGDINISSTPSTKEKADGKGIYFKEIKGTITGCKNDQTQFKQITPANFTISGTGKVTNGTDKCVREGDTSSSVSIVLVGPTGNPPPTVTMTTTVWVNKAGQSGVSSN